ncbi:MFS transporter [Rhodococcus sp. A14]|nr:MFS transporter [Rhodococcus sp. A14]
MQRIKRQNDYADNVALEIDGAIEMRASPVPALAGGTLLAIAVILTALNLRSAVTSVAPLLGDMQQDLAVSAAWAGVLTTLPVLCFAAAGLAAPRLATHLGLGRAISCSLAMITVGLAVRALDGPALVLGASLVACAGIALVNVLIPVVIKGSFPAKIGLMTGIYTAALQGGAAIGSALTPGLEQPLGGWRPALAIWAALAVTALVVWVLAARRHGATWVQAQVSETRRSLLRNRLAWTVTLFFGSQSFMAYIVMGWLPQVFIDAGVPKLQAGIIVGMSALIGVPIALVIAPLAARKRSQSAWIVGLSTVGVIGAVGAMVAPASHPVIWSIAIGVGQSVFALALTVIALRTKTTGETVQLSGMAQGFGYLIASAGPLFFGLLHELTHRWTASWILFLAVCTVQIVTGALAGRNRYV